MDTNNIPEIVQRAYNQGITDIGQLSKEEKYQLNKYVKSGYLMKYKSNEYPVLKWHYGMNWADFVALFLSDPDYIIGEEYDV